MAFASGGTLGTVAQTANNQASIVLTTSADLNAGEVGVIIVAVDNNQTTDGDEGACILFQDSAGNTWSKGAEFTNGQGSAQAGTTCSIWYVQAINTLSSGGTITSSYTNATSRDESCATAWKFTVGAGSTITLAGTNTLPNDGADPGSLDVATANAAHLRIRGIAGEVNTTTALTKTAAFDGIFSGTRSANVATAQSVCGEYAISTGTGLASDPTWVSGDMASVYIALLEVLPMPSGRMDRNMMSLGSGALLRY